MKLPVKIFRQTILKHAATVLMLACSTNAAHAEPWISTGNERARFHIQVLSDAGKFRSPISTWPIMWVNVQSALDEINIAELNATELWSYQYLRHSLGKVKNKFAGRKRLHVANHRPAIVDFSTDSREKTEASVSLNLTTNRMAFNIQASAVNKGDGIDADGNSVRLDGSYAIVNFGNWVFGVGAIDRWWGPGWQSSLVMSTNARPSSSLFIQRKSMEGFSWPILKWLGPWDLHLFANQLEEERHIPNAKLLGGRATIKPVHFIELGVSRVAQWGGDGRSENLESLKNIILGNDNQEKNDSTNVANSETSNQLFSYDWRIHVPYLKRFSLSFFHQQLSEDESEEDLPFRNADTWGVESSFRWRNINTHIAYETYDAKNDTNGIYEHSIYQSGYRYKNRTIGSSLGTSSLGQTLLVEHYLSNGHQINWRIGSIDFNYDDVPTNRPGGHRYGSTHIKEDFFEAKYTLPINDTLALSTEVFWLSEPLTFLDNEKIDSSIAIGLEFRW